LFGTIPNLPLAYHGGFREFEIIGEAVGKLPESFRERRPDVEWQVKKDFRNLLSMSISGLNRKSCGKHKMVRLQLEFT